MKTENQTMQFLKSGWHVMLLAMAVFFVSCKKEDDDDNTMDNNDMVTSGFVATDGRLQNGMLTVMTIDMEQNGWLVVHRDNGEGGPMVPEIISVPKYVEEGAHTDVKIELKDGVKLENGETVWIMLHTDNGELMEYEFDGENGLDEPLMNSEGDIIMTSLLISSVVNTGSFVANNQVISMNMVHVNSVTVGEAGWVVVHKDNGDGGPMVPEIISEPKHVSAGTTEDVMLQLTEDAGELMDGESVWIMLHTDDGEMMEYEFNGENGLDAPLTNGEGNIVTSSIIISSASITVNNQSVTNNQVIIQEVIAAKDGWIVIHNQTEEGGVVLPGIVGKTEVDAGMNSNVVIDLDETVTYEEGQLLFPMLHVDEAPIDEYNFPGVDMPEIFGFEDEPNDHIIVTSFMVEAE